jgi:hypothetical protein
MTKIVKTLTILILIVYFSDKCVAQDSNNKKAFVSINTGTFFS